MHVRWERDGTISANGRAIAQVDKSFWRERAEVVLEGQPWVFGTEFGGSLFAESQGRQQLRAEKAGFFGSSWRITGASDPTLEIKKAGLFSNGWSVLAQGEVVSEVTSGSFWTNRPEATLPGEVPPIEGVFVLWVCYTLSQRESAQNSSTT